MTRGWRGDDAGTSLAQAPRGGTIIKENQLNNDSKQDNGKRVLTRVKLVVTLVRSTLGGVQGGLEGRGRCLTRRGGLENA